MTIAKKIVEELMKIDSSIQKIEIELTIEATLHKEQMLKTKEFLPNKASVML